MKLMGSSTAYPEKLRHHVLHNRANPCMIRRLTRVHKFLSSNPVDLKRAQAIPGKRWDEVRAFGGGKANDHTYKQALNFENFIMLSQYFINVWN